MNDTLVLRYRKIRLIVGKSRLNLVNKLIEIMLENQNKKIIYACTNKNEKELSKFMDILGIDLEEIKSKKNIKILYGNLPVEVIEKEKPGVLLIDTDQAFIQIEKVMHMAKCEISITQPL